LTGPKSARIGLVCPQRRDPAGGQLQPGLRGGRGRRPGGAARRHGTRGPDRPAAALEVAQDYADDVMAPPDMLGVQSVTPYAVTLRVTAKTTPGRQWAVQRAQRPDPVHLQRRGHPRTERRHAPSVRELISAAHDQSTGPARVSGRVRRSSTSSQRGARVGMPARTGWCAPHSPRTAGRGRWICSAAFLTQQPGLAFGAQAEDLGVTVTSPVAAAPGSVAQVVSFFGAWGEWSARRALHRLHSEIGAAG
jgi:hypothetical protein